MLRLNCIILLVLACAAAATAQSNCFVAQNCTRTTLNPINSAQYVQCVSGVCACDGQNNCFTYNSSAAESLDACVLDTQCYIYTSLGACESTARSWLTALLLQVFIGEVGAANFYIGRDNFAGGQLFLFLVILIFPFFLCCASCGIHAAFGEGNNICGKLCGCSVVIAIIFLCIVIILCSFAVPIWWIADIIIFASNQRTDLNGCRLDQPF